MSADNWTVCPKCAKQRSERDRKEKDELMANYGVMNPDQFVVEIQNLKNRQAKPMEDSLREDYEIHIDCEGFLKIDYRASCKCGFKFSYIHEEVAPLD